MVGSRGEKGRLATARGDSDRGGSEGRRAISQVG